MRSKLPACFPHDVSLEGLQWIDSVRETRAPGLVTRFSTPGLNLSTLPSRGVYGGEKDDCRPYTTEPGNGELPPGPQAGVPPAAGLRIQATIAGARGVLSEEPLRRDDSRE